jgi:lysophospholipase L1-like esterase
LKSFKLTSRGAMLCSLVCALATTLPAQVVKNIDFSRLVVVGDSLAAGVENGSLEASQQRHGFAKVIARQIGTPLELPLVPYPGAPNTLELVSADFPPTIRPVPGVLLFPRLNPFDRVTDVAVPLQTVADALNRKPDNNLKSTDETQLATDLVLGFPCPVLVACPALTQVQQAVALDPTAVIVEIGNNDILGALTSGQFGALASSPAAAQQFLTSFGTNYAKLLSALASTRATLIIGNLPDVIQTAYFIPVAKLSETVKQPVDLLNNMLGTQPGDYVTLAALPSIEAILSGAHAGPLPPSCNCVVTAAQAALVRALTVQMNAIISSQAAAIPGSTVVDVFSLADRLYTHGYKLGRTKLSSDFLGGLFSLDGLHPTNTGYAIFANEFIEQINAAFGTHIRRVNIHEIAEDDPLVLSNRKRFSIPWQEHESAAIEAVSKQTQ